MDQIQTPQRSPLEQEIFDLKVEQYWLSHHPEQIYNYKGIAAINNRGLEIKTRLQELGVETGLETTAKILNFPLAGTVERDESEIAG